MSLERREPEFWDHVTEDTTFSFSEPHSHILKEQRLEIFPSHL